MAFPTKVWFEKFNQASKLGMLTLDECEKYADTVIKMCTLRDKILSDKEKRFIKIIKSPLPVSEKTCRATLMNGKQCSCKALVGEFCKRHRLVNNSV